MKEKMRHDFTWIIIIFIIVSVFFGFSIKTFKELNLYFKLSDQKEAQIKKYNLVQKKGKYLIQASYFFEEKDKIYSNTTIFKKKSFLNPFSANDHIKAISNETQKIWFNVKNPNISSLDKIFPYKKIIYTIIACCIVLYFLFLKIYVFSFQKNK